MLSRGFGARPNGRANARVETRAHLHRIAAEADIGTSTGIPTSRDSAHQAAEPRGVIAAAQNCR